MTITSDLRKKFHLCCNNVIMYCSNRYAISYAKAGLLLSEEEEVQTQALYILHNIQYWRGEYASNTRQALKDIIEEIA